METFIGTIAGIIIGGLITVWASRYFYKKSLKSKTLSCFVQYVSEILTDIDPDVKNNLEVDFKGQKVESLYQVQFVIANTGDIPIRDIINPLNLKIPNEGIILDANLLHIDPKGREINLDIADSNDSISFDFPLLNSGEYFISKLLIKGEPPRHEIKEGEENRRLIDYGSYDLFDFTITADELPPEIASQHLPPDYSEFEFNHFDKSTIWGGAIFGFLAFTVAFILYGIGNVQTDLFLFHFGEFFSNFSYLKFSIIVGWLLAAILGIAGIMIPASEIGGIRPKKKPKFKLPKKHSRYYRPF